MLRRFWYWLQTPYRTFQLLYPPPYTDEEYEADRAGMVRRLVEHRLGRSYITEADVDNMRKQVLGGIFSPAEKREWDAFRRDVKADVDDVINGKRNCNLDK